MKTRAVRTLFLPLFACVVAAGCGRQVAAPVAVAELRGSVMDNDGPVAGANVRIQATSHPTTTDANGIFHLPNISEAVTVTAWKEGAFIGSSRSDAAPLEILLKPLPIQDNPAYRWVDPGPSDKNDQNCARCHAEIVKEWSASAHSRSATDRHFRNLYDGTSWMGKPGVGWSLLDEHPTGAAVCTSCHAPAVADDDPAQFDLRELQGTAAKGVHCDYCHKIAGVGDGKFGLTHGRFNLRLLRPEKDQVFFGPLDDATRGNDAFSPLYHDSKYCASCHEGIVFGVHVYSTYSEWKESPAYKEGRQCQDCHMAPTGRMTNIAPGNGGVERDSRTLGNHLFFDEDQEAMLRKCLQTSVESHRNAKGVRVTVRLWTEAAGHRVPTGFIDKHLILLVDGEDAAGKPVALQSGPKLPSAVGMELEGKPGKLYAKLLRDFDGHSPAPFWRADPEAVDTRLTPGRTDESEFDFAPAAAKIRVRILYRRFWEEVGRSKGWPDADITILHREIE
jgi:Cytochrome c554 and c-prime